ncbi:MAG: TonB-dependent receptor [Bacteroidia bacterium]|nr:TonB-dependent receptor [Bacteroidia bacterium]
MKKLLTLCFCMLIGFTVQSQTISGTVTEDGVPLIGVSVSIDGTTTGTVTDLDGYYSLSVEPGNYNMTASYVGFSTVTKPVSVSAGQDVTLDFTLSSGIMVDEIVVTGTRANNRTNLESPVPVDVINVTQLANAAPQTSVNQILHYTTPSFSSNTQTISDGTDHIDPASLRGLGPDQVLVLINGKRRHTTSLVNVNGTFGRGNVGTDLNAIPAASIDKIEVLRDGAAAQYGSDAIAGVINIKLKEDVNRLKFNVTSGGNFTNNIGPFGGEEKSTDGETFNLGANYGLPLGDNGGFVNLTGELNYRGSTNRMQEFTGGIFNGLNGVERLAGADGFDVTALSLEQVQAYGNQVSYFDQSTKDALNALTSLDGLGDVLGFDATDSELSARGQQRSDYNMRVGQSETRGGKMFANMSLPLSNGAEIYGFGGTSYRRGESGCFYRLPSQNRTTTSIYPNGTVPKINSNISDKSLGAGIRGQLGSWNVDFSTVTGSNQFLFHITDTHNATLGSSSPTEFDAGGHSFAQTTSNLDFTKYYDGLNGIDGLNVAFGTEYRFENFDVIPGTELSYGNYDVNGNLVNSVTPDEDLTTDLLGRARPSGCQCFAGFLPSNQVDAHRSSIGAYLDMEADFSEAFLLGAAVRFENYSDFGSTFNYKISARYKVNNNLAFRGAYSTGFRAPSLHQIHFSRTSTIFTLVDGVSVPQEVGVFANTSRAANLLGIPELKQETSQNMSIGFTAKMPEANLRITVDAYQVNIDDRIILTGQFGPGDNEELQRLFDQSGATRAAFFANSINTNSKGLDIVLAHSIALNQEVTLRNDLAATFSKTTWDQDAGINASDILRDAGLVSTYFDQTSRIYLEQAVPRVKLTLGNSVSFGKVDVYLRNTYFGKTTEATNEPLFDEVDLTLLPNAALDPYNSGKIITDLSLGYEASESLNLSVGANNLLDVYPDEVESAFSSSGRFVYSRRSPQFSYNGRYLFVRAVLRLR